MKPPKINLDLKRLARETYSNGVRLYKDACLLYLNKSFASAHFLALSCVEEIGKVKMIDHFYVNMVLNYEFGIPKEVFVNALFARHNFYSHENKHSSALDGTFFWAADDETFWELLDIPEEYKDLKDSFKNPGKERQVALYVDYRKGKISVPEQAVSSLQVLKTLKAALYIIEDIEDMGLAGTYWTDTRKTKRKAKVIAEELKSFFKRCEAA